jgi:hypothetical protein
MIVDVKKVYLSCSWKLDNGESCHFLSPGRYETVDTEKVKDDYIRTTLAIDNNYLVKKKNVQKWMKNINKACIDSRLKSKRCVTIIFDERKGKEKGSDIPY